MKREAQVFEWTAKNGHLSIVGRKDGPMDGERLDFYANRYPADIQQAIADAGFKAVFQQRSSQIESDSEKLDYWTDLDALFRSGTWEREGGARGAPIVGAWVEVLAEVKGVEVGVIQASLAQYDKAKRDGIRATVEKKYAEKIAAKKATRRDTVDLENI